MAQRPTNQATTEDDEWEEVPTESQINLPNDGDEFVGTFVGWSTTTGKNIPQAHFTSVTLGQVFINCGASLKQQLKDVKVGTMTKIRRVGTQDTGQETPMILFKVWTRK